MTILFHCCSSCSAVKVQSYRQKKQTQKNTLLQQQCHQAVWIHWTFWCSLSLDTPIGHPGPEAKVTPSGSSTWQGITNDCTQALKHLCFTYWFCMFSEQLKPFSLETFGDLFSAMASFALADNDFEQSVEMDDADFPTVTPKRSLFQSPGSEQKKGPAPKVPSAMKASPKKKGSPKKRATKLWRMEARRRQWMCFIKSKCFLRSKKCIFWCFDPACWASLQRWRKLHQRRSASLAVAL